MCNAVYIVIVSLCGRNGIILKKQGIFATHSGENLFCFSFTEAHSFHMIFSLITLFSSNARKKERERDMRERKRERAKEQEASALFLSKMTDPPQCQANCLQYGPETQSTSIHKWQLVPPEKVQRRSKQARANNQVVTETTETGS